ncbi:MAG: hypothetical protein O3A46_15625 [Candidatus Poribacteria bacterium]|nr:hypothetical protein [Candidatus Poribacteria bacterium]
MWREWEHSANRVEIGTGDPVSLPLSAHRWVIVSETTRVRIALIVPNEKPPSHDADADPPKPPPIVHVAEMGDLFGDLTTPTSAVKPVMTTQALRGGILWLIPEDTFRGFVWKHGQWQLPAPLAARYGRINRRLYKVGARLEDSLPIPRLSLETLWGKTRCARASAALLELIRRGHDTIGNERRLKGVIPKWLFAQMIGANEDWVRMWIKYAESEHIIRHRLGRWSALDPWQLHRWADRRALDFTFDIPPDPFEEMTVSDPSVGRASRNSDGTTPTTPAPDHAR